MSYRIHLLAIALCLSSAIVIEGAPAEPAQWVSTYERIFEKTEAIQPAETMNFLNDLLSRASEVKSNPDAASKVSQVEKAVDAGTILGNKCNVQHINEVKQLQESQATKATPYAAYLKFYRNELAKFCRGRVISQVTLAHDLLPEDEELKKFKENVLTKLRATDEVPRSELINDLVAFWRKAHKSVADEGFGKDKRRKNFEKEFSLRIYLPCNTLANVIRPAVKLFDALSDDESFVATLGDDMKTFKICDALIQDKTNVIDEIFKALYSDLSPVDKVGGMMKFMIKSKH